MTSLVNTLRCNVIIMILTIARYGGNRKDQSLTAEVAKDHNADQTKLTVQKKLLDCPESKAIQKKDTEIRTLFNRLTARWDEGQGLIGAAKIVDTKVALQTLIREREALVSAFVAKLPDLINADRVALNGTFDPSDYPSEAELRARFSVKLTFRPVETTFATDLIEDSLKQQLQSDLDQAVAQQFTEANRELTERLADRLTILINAIKRQDAKEDARFKGDLIDSVSRVCTDIKQANFSNDPRINSLADTVAATINKFDADTIKENPDIRKENVQTAEAQLAEVQQLMAGFNFGS